MKTQVFQDVGTMNYCSSPETVGDHEGESLPKTSKTKKNLILKNIFKIRQYNSQNETDFYCNLNIFANRTNSKEYVVKKFWFWPIKS